MTAASSSVSDARPSPPAPTDVAIEVQGLRMRYGSVDVLKGVDFQARRGAVLALLGSNGRP